VSSETFFEDKIESNKRLAIAGLGMSFVLGSTLAWHWIDSWSPWILNWILFVPLSLIFLLGVLLSILALWRTFRTKTKLTVKTCVALLFAFASLAVSISTTLAFLS
jgi:hypothetical protein